MHNDVHSELKLAKILAFERPTTISKPRGRGRPRKSIPKGTDYGTPELAMKRAHSMTTETLDLCLERQLILPQQHWCGIHLRWLFTLRHGAPGLRALDPSHLGGHSPKTDDPDWRINREQEYREAMHALALSGQISLIINVCVYNDRPAFLILPTTKKQALKAANDIEGLRKGLDILVKLWNRNQRHN